MTFQQSIDINIGYRISVGKEKWLVSYKTCDALNATTCHSIESRIYYRDLPGLRMIIVHFNAVAGKIERNIRHMEKIISKKLFNDMLFISGTNNKFANTVIGIQLHNVPQNRLVANLYHRLRAKLAFFRNAGAEAARKNNCFHSFPP